MEITLKGDYLSINIMDILERLTPNQEQELIERLSCSDTVISYVMQQVLEGFTENGYSGNEHCSVNSVVSNPTPLEKARLDIIDKQEEVTQKMVQKLKREVLRANEYEKEYRDKYWELYHKQ